MKFSTGTKTPLWMGAISFIFLCFMLFFRAVIYPGMYIGEGDAYGISDIV